MLRVVQLFSQRVNYNSRRDRENNNKKYKIDEYKMSINNHLYWNKFNQAHPLTFKSTNFK